MIDVWWSLIAKTAAVAIVGLVLLLLLADAAEGWISGLPGVTP